MIKYLLALVIIGSGIAAGYLQARPYRNRTVHLRDLNLAINMLEGDMNYKRDTLLTLLKRNGTKIDNLSGVFFFKVCEKLQSVYTYDFSVAWRDSALEVYGHGSLTHEDLEYLVDMGMELGRTDLAGQKNMFDRTKKRLEAQERAAIEENINKGRLYKGIYSALGILTVIVLI